MGKVSARCHYLTVQPAAGDMAAGLVHYEKIARYAKSRYVIIFTARITVRFYMPRSQQWEEDFSISIDKNSASSASEIKEVAKISPGKRDEIF